MRASFEQSITRIETHGVGAVFVQEDAHGHVLVLAHEYTGPGREGQVFTSLRMPFGSGQLGERPAATLHREILEEVAADHANFDFEVVSPAPVFWEVVPDDETRARTHLKAFFLVRLRRGAVRDVPRLDDPGTGAEERHGPLQLIEIGHLLSRMWREKAPRVHRLAVVGALVWMAREKPAVALRYGRLCALRQRDLRSFEPYHPVVYAYLGLEE